MKKENKYRTPKPNKADITHTLVCAGIASIPVIGGAGVEFFKMLITPSIEKRRQKWMEEVAKGLKELEDNKFILIEDLKNNETFITTVMQASQTAIRNHQKEKLEALRNAVLNAALPNAPEEDLQVMFLNLIDTLTVSHIKILHFLNDPHALIKKHGIQFDGYTKSLVAF